MTPTKKQRDAVNNIVGNHGNITKSMREAGYSEASVQNPKNLTESKGYLEALDEVGLTQELLTSSLTNDIKEKGELPIEKRNRTRELELGMKARNMLGQSGEGGGTVINLLLSVNDKEDVAKIKKLTFDE